MCNSKSTICFAGSYDYGTCFDNKDITLGVADCFAVRGIYEGVGGSTPLPPSAYLEVHQEHL